MKTLTLIVMFLLVSCSSMVKKVSGPIDHKRLFPDGKYRHHVFLVQKDGNEREFDGVLKLSQSEIVLVGLSHFGSTVFQVVDKKGSAPEVVIYFEPMQKFENQFREFYLSIRNTLVQKNDQKPTASENLSVNIGKNDENGIPESFEIHHKKFDVKVTVEGYEL